MTRLHGSALTYALTCDETQANFLPAGVSKSSNCDVQDTYRGNQPLRYFKNILPGETRRTSKL